MRLLVAVGREDEELSLDFLGRAFSKGTGIPLETIIVNPTVLFLTCFEFTILSAQGPFTKSLSPQRRIPSSKSAPPFKERTS